MIIELQQVKDYFISLSPEERKDLCEAIAENIYFLDCDLQERVFELIGQADPVICKEIRKINGFTS